MRPRGTPLACLISFLLITWCLLTAFPPFCSAQALRKATFVPQWLPQAQFAGYYVAKEKGIYRKFGIDLTILPGGPDRPPFEMLAREQADFTTMFLATGIQRRAAKEGVVNIGQIMRRSGYVLVARKASRIESPKDMEGKKVSLWEDFRWQPLAFFRTFNIRPRLVTQGSTVNLFLRGGVDVVSAMWYNEYHTIINSGLDENELTLFFLDRYGLNFPEDGIYCREETIRKNRALCRDFLRATIEGWQYAFAHPDEALDIVMRYIDEARGGSNRVHQKWMLERMRDLILPPGNKVPMGLLTEAEFQGVARALAQGGLITAIPPYREFYVDLTREQ